MDSTIKDLFDQGLVLYEQHLFRKQLQTLSDEEQEKVQNSILSIADSLMQKGETDGMGLFYSNVLILLCLNDISLVEKQSKLHETVLENFMNISILRTATAQNSVYEYEALVTALEEERFDLNLDKLIRFIQQAEDVIFYLNSVSSQSPELYREYSELNQRVYQIVKTSIEVEIQLDVMEEIVVGAQEKWVDIYKKALALSYTLPNLLLQPHQYKELEIMQTKLLYHYTHTLHQEDSGLIRKEILPLQYKKDYQCFKSCLEKDDFARYIVEFPEGLFIHEALLEDAQISKLTELHLWEICKKSGDYGNYLSQYPEGMFAPIVARYLSNCN